MQTFITVYRFLFGWAPFPIPDIVFLLLAGTGLRLAIAGLGPRMYDLEYLAEQKGIINKFLGLLGFAIDLLLSPFLARLPTPEERIAKIKETWRALKTRISREYDPGEFVREFSQRLPGNNELRTKLIEGVRELFVYEMEMKPLGDLSTPELRDAAWNEYLYPLEAKLDGLKPKLSEIYFLACSRFLAELPHYDPDGTMTTTLSTLQTTKAYDNLFYTLDRPEYRMSDFAKAYRQRNDTTPFKLGAVHVPIKI